MKNKLEFKDNSAFTASKKNVLSNYKRAESDIKDAIAEVKKNPNLGDLYPGVGGHGIRKTRFPLRTYNIGKRGGLRFIFLPTPRAIVPIHIYVKKKWRNEHEVVRVVKANLALIVKELGPDALP